MTQQLVVALLPLALLAASPARSFGQSPAPPAIVVAAPDVQEITLRDGTRAFGRVERVARLRALERRVVVVERRIHLPKEHGILGRGRFQLSRVERLGTRGDNDRLD